MNRRPPPWLPWVACAVSTACLAAGVVLHLTSRDVAGADTAETVAVVSGLVATVPIPVVGALLADRLPGNAYGWVWVGIGAALGLMVLMTSLRQAALVPYWRAGLVELGSFLVVLRLLVPAFLLFPTGHPPGPRWRWLSRASTALFVALLLGCSFGSWAADPAAASPWALPAAPANPARSTPWALAGAAGRRWETGVEVGIALALGLAVVAMSSVVVRARRAGQVERRQTGLVLVATALAGLTLVPELADLHVGDTLWPTLNQLALSLVPVSVGVAVLRHRLFDLDHLVRRAVSYALLTAGLVSAYVLVVTVLRQLLVPLTGTSELAVAASTLAVAALFQPVRRRVQAAVDRRFDRARYDAARTVDAYARRLRTEVDLETVTTGLRDTVAATVGPERVGLWLRTPRAAGEG